MTRTLAELRRRHVIEARPLDAATERTLRADPRAGARAILNAVERRRFEARSEGQRLRKMFATKQYSGTEDLTELRASMKPG